jgi:hypothetical protein
MVHRHRFEDKVTVHKVVATVVGFGFLITVMAKETAFG